MRKPQFTPLDLRTWKRGQMFYYFARMAPTGYSLTVDVDITRMLAVCRGGWDQILPRIPVAGHKMPEPADGISDRGKGGTNRIL